MHVATPLLARSLTHSSKPWQVRPWSTLAAGDPHELPYHSYTHKFSLEVNKCSLPAIRLN